MLTQKLYTTSCERHQTYPMFLDGHVSEVHKHVVQFAGAGCVLHCAEPAEAQLIPESRMTERERLLNNSFLCAHLRITSKKTGKNPLNISYILMFST